MYFILSGDLAVKPDHMEAVPVTTDLPSEPALLSSASGSKS